MTFYYTKALGKLILHPISYSQVAGFQMVWPGSSGFLFNGDEYLILRSSTWDQIFSIIGSGLLLSLLPSCWGQRKRGNTSNTGQSRCHLPVVGLQGLPLTGCLCCSFIRLVPGLTDTTHFSIWLIRNSILGNQYRTFDVCSLLFLQPVSHTHTHTFTCHSWQLYYFSCKALEGLLF